MGRGVSDTRIGLAGDVHDDVVLAFAKGAEILERIVVGAQILIERIRDCITDEVAARCTLRDRVVKEN